MNGDMGFYFSGKTIKWVAGIVASILVIWKTGIPIWEGAHAGYSDKEHEHEMPEHQHPQYLKQEYYEQVAQPWQRIERLASDERLFQVLAGDNSEALAEIRGKITVWCDVLKENGGEHERCR